MGHRFITAENKNGHLLLYYSQQGDPPTEENTVVLAISFMKRNES